MKKIVADEGHRRTQGCMIVDDDPQMLALLNEIVESVGGCRTRCFASGDDAWRAFEEATGEFALVLTDWNMPGLDGIELGQRIHALAPDVKIVLVTANAFLLDEGDRRRMDFSGVLEKPVTIEALRGVIRLVTQDAGAGGPDLHFLNNLPIACR